jgi:hypothetical protein
MAPSWIDRHFEISVKKVSYIISRYFQSILSYLNRLKTAKSILIILILNAKIYYMAPLWIGRHLEISTKRNIIHHLKAFPKCIHLSKSDEKCKNYRPKTPF